MIIFLVIRDVEDPRRFLNRYETFPTLQRNTFLRRGPVPWPVDVVNTCCFVAVGQVQTFTVCIDPVELGRIAGYCAYKRKRLGTRGILEVESRKWVTVREDTVVGVCSVKV